MNKFRPKLPRQLEQQAVGSTDTSEQLQAEVAEGEQAEKMPEKSTERTEESKEPRGPEPLDVQRLKAIAALAKQLQGPYRQKSSE
ncbi:MAG: hypothetical protein ACYTBV_20405 [Planctomycetota bacterium]|jgi:hypothetical protein